MATLMSQLAASLDYEAHQRRMFEIGQKANAEVAERRAKVAAAVEKLPKPKKKKKITQADLNQGAGKPFVVGIDPGAHTGFAVWSREAQQFQKICTMDFWDAVFAITRSETLTPDNTVVVVEIAHLAPITFRRGKADSFATMDRMARNVGQVIREAQLLAEGLRRFGFDVIEHKPIGKVKTGGKYDADEDDRQFKQLTGWTDRTSQHGRDAGRLIFKM